MDKGTCNTLIVHSSLTFVLFLFFFLLLKSIQLFYFFSNFFLISLNIILSFSLVNYILLFFFLSLPLFVSSFLLSSCKLAYSYCKFIIVMVPKLQSVMNSSVTINTGLCTYSRQTLGSRTDFQHYVHMLYYTLLKYFVPCKPELCYFSRPFTNPQL